MKKNESWIYFGVFAFLFLWLTYCYNSSFDLGYGDSTFLRQLLDNIARRGQPLSQVSASVKIFFDEILGKDYKTVCQLSLEKPTPREFNYFHWHPYLILYLVAPLTWVFGSQLTLAALTIASFLIPIIGIVFFLRKAGLSQITVLAACLPILSHPVWATGILGQAYVDRWLVGLLFLFAAIIRYMKTSIWWVLFLGFLVAISSDRNGAIAGIILIGFWTLNTQFRKRFGFWPLVGGAFFIGTSVFLIRFFIQYQMTGSFLSSMSPLTFWSNLTSNEQFQKGLLNFFVLNVALFGLICIFSWKDFLIALGVMLPNFLGNIGGAEKTGYLTHYHSAYFPLLAIAFLGGTLALHQKHRQTWVQIGYVVFCVTISWMMLGLFKHGQTDLTWKGISESHLAELIQNYKNIEDGPMKQRLELIARIDQLVPQGVGVSAPEEVMPILAKRDRDVHLYPVGMKDADYLVVPFEKDRSGEILLLGAVSYYGEEDNRLQNKCLTQKAISYGLNPKFAIQVGHLLIISRQNSIEAQKSR